MVADKPRIVIIGLREGLRVNAALRGRKFTSAFIEPGIVDYSDVGLGRELIRKETIEKALRTFVDRPLQISHRRNSPSEGEVQSAFFDKDTGWFCCTGECNDRAQAKIKAGLTVSCAYNVVRHNGTPGRYHGISYERELTEIEFDHLAIVENPRYEGATIRLNSKPKGKNTMNFKFWQKPAQRQNAGDKSADDKSASRDNNVPEISADTQLDIGAEKPVTVAQLVEGYRANEEAKAEGRENEISPESTLEVDGKEVTIGELVESFRANAKDDDKDDEKKDKDKDEKRDNARAAADSKPANFQVLKVARERNNGAVSIRGLSPDTSSQRQARGLERYGRRAGAGIVKVTTDKN